MLKDWLLGSPLSLLRRNITEKNNTIELNNIKKLITTGNLVLVHEYFQTVCSWPSLEILWTGPRISLKRTSGVTIWVHFLHGKLHPSCHQTSTALNGTCTCRNSMFIIHQIQNERMSYPYTSSPCHYLSAQNHHHHRYTHTMREIMKNYALLNSRE